MGNSCKCIRRSDTTQIEIIVDDARNVTIRDIRTNANIKKIRFILPIIKVTDDNNQEHLVYHPEGTDFTDYELSRLGAVLGRTIAQASTSKPSGSQMDQPPDVNKDYLDLSGGLGSHKSSIQKVDSKDVSPSKSPNRSLGFPKSRSFDMLGLIK